MMDTRGATETLGFVLAFAIVTASIGIVYTAGFGGLQDTRDAEQTENVERAFDVLASNIEDVRRYGTPSRATEIRILDGRLALTSQTSITVNISGGMNQTLPMRPLAFIAADGSTSIAYEGGAVFRTDDGNSLMISDPGWLIGKDRLVIPVVQTFRRGGPNELNIQGTSLVVAHARDRLVDQTMDAAGTTVAITVSSPRAAAWGRYFEDKGFTQTGDGPADGSVTYELTREEIYVIRAIVGLELSL